MELLKELESYGCFIILCHFLMPRTFYSFLYLNAQALPQFFIVHTSITATIIFVNIVSSVPCSECKMKLIFEIYIKFCIREHLVIMNVCFDQLDSSLLWQPCISTSVNIILYWVISL